jgi:hypothetical protein
MRETMKRLIGVLILGSCIAMSPAFAARSKAPKVHLSKSAKAQRKHLKKEQNKVRKEAKSRAKVRQHKSV